MPSKRFFAALATILAVLVVPSIAGDVEIVDARAVPTGGGAYTFHVTLEHGDTGWDHYADRWDVMTPDGAKLGERVLLHPHETEQPFTRSQSGIVVPEGLTSVIIRAHDTVHGLSPQEYLLDLPVR